MKGFPLISVIVPTWNRRLLLDSCLQSILNAYAHCKKNFLLEIIVVDNGSMDQSAELVRTKYHEVCLLTLAKNYGFSVAINAGIQSSKGKYIIILQSDLLLHTNYFLEMYAVLKNNKENFSLFGPKVYSFPYYQKHHKRRFIKVYGSIDKETLQLVNTGGGEIDTGQYDSVIEVPCTAFSGFLIDKHVFQTIGLMDERYFLYYEDNDFFIRVMAGNIQARLVPGAIVWDRDERTFGRNTPQVTYYLTRNYLLLLAKYQNMPFLQHVKNVKFMMSSLLFSFLGSQKKEHYRAIYSGISDFYMKRFGYRHGQT